MYCPKKRNHTHIAYSSLSTSSTVGRGTLRWVTAPEGGAASEPVGCGADSTFVGADGGVVASGCGETPPFLAFEGLPLVLAFPAALAAFFSFFTRFRFLMSSGVWKVLDVHLQYFRALQIPIFWVKYWWTLCGRGLTYLLPCPCRPERVEEAHVLE